MSITNRAVKLFKENKLYVILLLFIIAINVLPGFIDFPQEKSHVLESQETVNWQGNFPSESKIRELVLSGDVYALGLVFLATLFFLLFFIGVIMDILFIVFKARGQKILAKNYILPQIKWQLIDVVRVIILFLFISCIIYIVNILSFKIFHLKEVDRFMRLAWSLTISYILIISLLIYFISIKYQSKLQTLGLHLKNFFKNIFLGFASYIAIVPILFSVFLIVASVSSFLKYTPESPHPLVEVLSIENRNALLFYFIALTCLIGPVIEEIFFRGFLYTALRKSFGSTAAIIVSAVFFAFLHTTLIGFFPILTLGLLLAYLYEKNGTLIPSITVHVIYNSAIVAFFMLLKGLWS